jgi:hypothetical protein
MRYEIINLKCDGKHKQKEKDEVYNDESRA